MDEGVARARDEGVDVADGVGMATASVMATARHVMDVRLWLTSIGDSPATLVMTAESVERDAQAQRDQARVLLEYLASD
jgi:hypothetical protein